MAGDVCVCPRCSDNFIVNTKYLTCESCCKLYHSSCLNLKDVYCKFISESKNLIWVCDECNVNLPKNIRINALSEYKEMKCEIAILNKEVECLTREKQLMDKLISELQLSSKLLQSKHCEYEQETYKNKNNSKLNSSMHGSTTYSDVLKTNSESAVLLIKSKDNSISNNIVFKNITESVNPAGVGVCVNGTKKIRDGVAVYCENTSGMSKLKNVLVEKLGSAYTFSESKKLKPRLMIKNVILNEDIKSDEDIVHNIFSLNDLSQFETEDLKVVIKLKHFDKYNIVIQVSPALRKLLLAKGHLWIGWKKAMIEDYLRVMRCFKCSGFGHMIKDCKSNSTICPNCSENHLLKDCNSSEHKCIHCMNYNQRHKSNLAIDHTVKDICCPVFISYVENLKSRIDYE